MPSGPITVVIAADWALIRAGVRYALKGDPRISVVGEGATDLETVALVLRLNPDVLILGFRPAFPVALDVARRIQANRSATRVLVIASQLSRTDVNSATSAGVTGFLLETAREEEITGAVRSMTRGNVILPAAVAARFLQRGSVSPEEGLPNVPLTERELEILRLAALGMRNKDIADRLRLSARTVEGHLSRTFEKLNVGSRTEAILYAAERGWLVIPDAT